MPQQFRPFFDELSDILNTPLFHSSRVINWSYGDPRIRLHLPVGVAYRSDVDQVKRLLLEAARSHPQVRTHPEPDVGFTPFGDSALQFDLFFWVGEAKGGVRVLSDLRCRIHQRFKESGIEIPFPQREILVKTAPPPPDGGAQTESK